MVSRHYYVLDAVTEFSLVSFFGWLSWFAADNYGLSLRFGVDIFVIFAASFYIILFSRRFTDPEVVFAFDVISVMFIGFVAFSFFSDYKIPHFSDYATIHRLVSASFGIIAGSLFSRLARILKPYIYKVYSPARSKMPTSERRNIFKQSIYRRLSDVVHGIWHGLIRRDHLFNPIYAYSTHLYIGVSAIIGNNSHDIQNIKASIDRLTLEKNGILESKIENIKQNISEIEVSLDKITAEIENIESSDTEFKEAKEEFDRWHRAVKRPPFSEAFSTLSVDPESRKANGAEQNGPINSWSKLLTFVVSFLRESISTLIPVSPINIFAALVLPSEVLFTYKAFQFITGDEDIVVYGLTIPSAIAPLASATLFCSSLFLVGMALGSFLSKIYIYEVDDKDNELVKKPDINGIAAALFIGALALFIISVGASLRTTVREIVAITKEQQSQTTELTAESSNTTGFNIDDSPTKLFERNSERSVEDRINDVYKGGLFSFIDSKDGNTAFAIYMVLVLTSALKRRFAADPILPYHIVTINYDNNKKRIAIKRFNFELQRSVMNTAIESLRTELVQLNKGSTSSFREIIDIDNEIEKCRRYITEIESDKISLNRNLELYIRERVQRYITYYRVFYTGRQNIDELSSEYFKKGESEYISIEG